MGFVFFSCKAGAWAEKQREAGEEAVCPTSQKSWKLDLFFSVGLPVMMQAD